MKNILAAVGYVFSVVLVNWLVITFGVIPVGFGLYAPAGVFVAGLAFILRDVIQEGYGKFASIALIVLGSVVSYAISGNLAFASAAAFLASETLDFCVYTPLRKKNWYVASFSSNVVGAVVDSAVFLVLAFGSLDYIVGQVVGKIYSALVVVVFKITKEKLQW